MAPGQCPLIHGRGFVRYDHIYTDPESESYFASVGVEMSVAQYAPPAPPLHVSEPLGVENTVFFRAPVGWVGESHPSPRRQLYVGLEGQLEITVSSGETRRFGPGSVVLLEDVEGAGHVTRVVGDSDASGMFVHLA